MRSVQELIYPAAGKRKHIFFSGKGGVGKTSMACSMAVAAAAKGYRTLLMTTDPAAHIGNILERPVHNEVTALAGIPNLSAIKIDPKQAAEVYKAKILANAKEKFSASTVLGMEEELNSPCTEEMAAFQKFIDYASQDDFDVIVIDTAPTGHTLRLLELPMDWSKQLQVKAGLVAEISAEDQAQQARFDKIIALMKDPEATTFAFVMYPEKTPVIEAWRASEELASFGIATQLVVANLVIPAEQATTPFFQNRRNMQLTYIAEIKKRFAGAALVEVPLFAQEIKGLGMVKAVAQQIFNEEIVIMNKKKVLFLCTHNSARSQMAEGLLRAMYGKRYEVFSAGTEVTRVNPYALKSMAEIGIDLSCHCSKHLQEFLKDEIDYVVTVCDSAYENCPYFPNAKNRVHKSFPDPSKFTGTEEEILKAIASVREEIKSWIQDNFREK